MLLLWCELKMKDKIKSFCILDSHGYLSLYLFLFATTLFLAKAASSPTGSLQTEPISCAHKILECMLKLKYLFSVLQ